MPLFPTHPLGRALAAALFAGLTLLAGCGGDDDAFVDADGDAASVPPLPLPGPQAVGCSNVAQDFSRVGSASEVEAYWEGRRRPDCSNGFSTPSSPPGLKGPAWGFPSCTRPCRRTAARFPWNAGSRAACALS